MFVVKSSLYDETKRFISIDDVFDAMYLWYSRSNTRSLQVAYTNGKMPVGTQFLNASESPIYFSFLDILLRDAGFEALDLTARRDTGGETYFRILKETSR